MRLHEKGILHVIRCKNDLFFFLPGSSNVCLLFHLTKGPVYPEQVLPHEQDPGHSARGGIHDLGQADRAAVGDVCEENRGRFGQGLGDPRGWQETEGGER